MKGLILINSYTDIRGSYFQANSLTKEFLKNNIAVDILKNNQLKNYINSNGKAINNLNNYDFCVFLDKDKYILKLLELTKIRLFNSSKAIEICDDKMLTHIALSNNNICMPKTIPGLLCYTNDSIILSETIDKIESLLDYPIIIKNSFGSLGSGVFIAENRKKLLEIMNKVKFTPHLFQECITSSLGKDVRVIVIDNEVVASMKRTSTSDFRSNVGLGGKGEKIVLPSSFKKMALDISRILKLDYCGIDILFGKENEPILCEVNSNAFFEEISKITNINIAKKYVEYIIKVMK